MNPLAHLILDSLAARGWRKADLVTAMGYRDLGRGLRRLDACLRGEEVAEEVLRRVQQALSIPEARWTQVLGETRSQQQETERQRRQEALAARQARFRPYIYVLTSESRPVNITAAAVIGPRLRFLYLEDELLRLPRPARIARVADRVQDHFRANLGKCLLFGDIVGYRFQIAYDEVLVLDVTGSVREVRTETAGEEPEACLQVKHSSLHEGLFAVCG